MIFTRPERTSGRKKLTFFSNHRKTMKMLQKGIQVWIPLIIMDFFLYVQKYESNIFICQDRWILNNLFEPNSIISMAMVVQWVQILIASFGSFSYVHWGAPLPPW
jgi:purine-cytosine permease-like protein